MIFLLESRSTTARFEGGSAPPSFTRDRVALQCDNNARAEMRSYYGSFPPGDFVHKSVKVCASVAIIHVVVVSSRYM